ncbi:efflux RND transporter periplasmic adaptor subunit [Roseibium sp. RKSG952]|uniref:efflux RND transporter periplasmic adaptor subunit n=1 Tax=Roseibium sp. RKSG952 TaxID=2529384 RepID=UPI0012BCDB96|nr:HlyD family efflux transporter periplasmic adaptor subunit [Roseibium sp. RKSG952]MTH98138.1 HlyD family efflux transporter periplasmic adaptor subunit [Roseibium sp. RKSG952]
MRFLLRGLAGLLMAAVIAASLGYGIYRVTSAGESETARRSQPVGERSYSVNVGVFQPETTSPVTTAYGTIESWRTLQIRASSEGRIVDIARKFRDGAAVAKGDLLLRIDPADAEFQLLDAEAALSDAQAQKAEAEEAIVAAEQELTAARRQLDLRKQSLERQKALKEKGYSTMVQVESEELGVASLEQSLSNRLQSVVTARRRVERMDVSVKRAEIAVKDAQRLLAETSITVPYDGYLDQVDATLGRHVNPSETLAQLIDPTALEARFTLSTREFARFLDDRGRLTEVPLTIDLELGERSIEMSGHLDRAAAVVEEGQGGRTVFAAIDVGPDTILRPGDFVTVRLEEPEMSNVARVPASAALEDGRMLVLGDDNRLEEIRARILRRLGDELIVADVPFGTAYIQERLPHLGTGLKVAPRQVAPETPEKPGMPGTAQTDGGVLTAAVRPDMVELTDDQRSTLLAMLAATDLPEDRKALMAATLAEPMVPKQMIERLERVSGKRG